MNIISQKINSCLDDVLGDSAGGNLVAAVTLQLRDEKFIPQPKIQILIYPSLQPINFETKSYVENSNDGILSRHHQLQSWLLYAQGNIQHQRALLENNHTSQDFRKYFSEKYTKDDRYDYLYTPTDSRVWENIRDVFTDKYFAPLLETDLKNLPRTLMVTMNYDILRDEGMWFAQGLEAAGNVVKHVNYEQGFHGLFLFHGFMESDQIYSDIKEFVADNI